ncbi:MAG: AbrB/MazE/SpoVT family DNA-binding domain-containing protein [Planctomycetes bacterium]|nr:AbrB/MazE/SpoVT family DNA-binding domain-containing protein [Planctomycetota bacterium]
MRNTLRPPEGSHPPSLMENATLSSRGQVVVPRRIREALGLKAGRKLAFHCIEADRIEVLVLPEDPVAALEGMFKECPVSMSGEIIEEHRRELEQEERGVRRLGVAGLGSSRAGKPRRTVGHRGKSSRAV